jgi:hypothetical protein
MSVCTSSLERLRCLTVTEPLDVCTQSFADSLGSLRDLQEVCAQNVPADITPAVAEALNCLPGVTKLQLSANGPVQGQQFCRHLLGVRCLRHLDLSARYEWPEADAVFEKNPPCSPLSCLTFLRIAKDASIPPDPDQLSQSLDFSHRTQRPRAGFIRLNHRKPWRMVWQGPAACTHASDQQCSDKFAVTANDWRSSGNRSSIRSGLGVYRSSRNLACATPVKICMGLVGAHGCHSVGRELLVACLRFMRSVLV